MLSPALSQGRLKDIDNFNDFIGRKWLCKEE